MVTELSEKLLLSKDANAAHGCIEALANLCEEYPPVCNVRAWGCRIERHR